MISVNEIHIGMSTFQKQRAIPRRQSAKGMRPTEPSAELVRKQLEQILASSGFLRNDRLSKFLRFLVEQQLAGKTAELKESVLGIVVFGRRAGYDTRQDSVVRTEAAQLRDRLSK